MTDQETLDLVKKMRDAQKKYFRDRTAYNLQLAKHLELRVDKALEAAVKDAPKEAPTRSTLDL